MNMNWDYAQRQVHGSMLDYAPEALTRSRHRKPRTLQHQPYRHVKPNYGAKAQFTKSGYTAPALPKEGKKFIQEVIGTSLYYARCVDTTILVALGSLATLQANSTKNTMAKATQFLNYAATHPDAIVTYNASNMVLAGHSNALYLSESNARSRAGGHFFMSNDTTKPPNNGAILTTAQIIKAVMSSAAEAEVGASEAAPCPLQPCHFAKWDIFADTLNYPYVMVFPVCILNNFLPIFPISCHLLMLDRDCPIFEELFFQYNLDSDTSLFFCFFV